MGVPRFDRRQILLGCLTLLMSLSPIALTGCRKDDKKGTDQAAADKKKDKGGDEASADDKGNKNTARSTADKKGNKGADKAAVDKKDKTDNKGADQAAVDKKDNKGADQTTRTYDGSLDQVDGEAISGWAWDSTKPESPIKVDIYDGDEKLATVPADEFRPDLKKEGKGDGKHAFQFRTPDALKKGGKRHTIRVKYAGTNVELPGSGKELKPQ
jgi:hypothetical protein